MVWTYLCYEKNCIYVLSTFTLKIKQKLIKTNKLFNLVKQSKKIKISKYVFILYISNK